MTAGLAHCNADIALDTATVALENNLAPTLYYGVMTALRVLYPALVATNAVLTTVDIIEGVEENGVEGGLHVLQEDTALGMTTLGMGKPIKAARNMGKTAKVAKKGAEKVSKNGIEALNLTSVSRKSPIHKNSLDYVGETHLYVIRDASGKMLKYGESAVGKNALGQSKRAEAQVRKLMRQHPGKDFSSSIINEYDSKRLVKVNEANYIRVHRKIFEQDSLPLNKNNH